MRRRDRDQRRRALFCGLILAGLGAAFAFAPRDLPRRLSVAALRAGGYDGCLCSDCATHFGFPDLPRPRCCGGGGSGVELAAFPLWTASVIVLLGAALRRRPPPDPHRCGRCGYDLTGCMLSVCPECGAERGTRA